LLRLHRAAADHNDAWLVVADCKSYICEFELYLLARSQGETQYDYMASLDKSEVSRSNSIPGRNRSVQELGRC
jgi:hypothetical protein